MSELQTQQLPRYQIDQSYEWNYTHAPEPVECVPPEVPGEWSFCGYSVSSPLGVPAGPLLNGRWVLYYASLGFDVLTYKTVRSVSRDCYPLPNLQPVETQALQGNESELVAASDSRSSWAVSFGMPSRTPDQWRADVEQTRCRLDPRKVLNVSVVASEQPGWGLDDLAADYAQCAQWACESGADTVETNFSCPNVTTCDGQLYQHPQDAGRVAACVRAAIGDVPLIAKIGHVDSLELCTQLIAELSPSVTAIAMTNSVATRVRTPEGQLMFDGNKRGICGAATLEASVHQVRMFQQQILKSDSNLELIGVGGASSASDVGRYLDAGASSVHLATAAMLDPAIGLSIREQLALSRQEVG